MGKKVQTPKPACDGPCCCESVSGDPDRYTSLRQDKKKKDDDWEEEAGLDPDLLVSEPSAQAEEEPESKQKLSKQVCPHLALAW